MARRAPAFTGSGGAARGCAADTSTAHGRTPRGDRKLNGICMTSATDRQSCVHFPISRTILRNRQKNCREENFRSPRGPKLLFTSVAMEW